jgi:hypothetical protein
MVHIVHANEILELVWIDRTFRSLRTAIDTFERVHKYGHQSLSSKHVPSSDPGIGG